MPEASPDVNTRRDSSTHRLSTSQTKLDDLFTKTIGGKVEVRYPPMLPPILIFPVHTYGDILGLSLKGVF